MTELAYHQWADDREYKLVKEAQDAAHSGNWTVGENASLWLQQYGRGKNDAVFAELIGLTEDQVYQRRKVWESFGKIHHKFRWLTWSHFREAMNLRNPEEALEWANEQRATIKEMTLWSRVNEGQIVIENRSVPAAKAERLESPSDRESVPRPERTRTPEDSRLRDPEPSARHGADRDRDRPADVPVPVADQRPEAVPSVVNEPTETITMALAKVHEVIQFVMDNGTDSQIDTLRTLLQDSLDLLQPLELTGKKKQSELPLASRSMTNVVVEAWNMIDGVIRCNSITDNRRKALAARLKDQFWKENWENAIERIRNLPCLHGQNDTKWRADFDWFVRTDTVTKVIEGKYDNWKPTGTKGDQRREQNRSAFDEVFG